MVRVTPVLRLSLAAAAALGVIGGLLDLYFLIPLSLLALLAVLSLPAGFRKQQMLFLFPLVFLACLPVNVRLALALSLQVQGSPFYSLLFSLILFFSLISVEELLMGLAGLLLWGDQKLIREDHSLRTDIFWESPACGSKSRTPGTGSSVPPRYLRRL